jgi:hypothetical protein
VAILYVLGVIVAAVILFFTGVGVRTLQDYSRQSLKYRGQAKNGEGAPRQSPWRASKIFSLVAGFPYSEQGAPEEPGEQHNRLERMAAESTRRISNLTWALVVATVVSAFVSFFTLLAIRGQLDEMRDEQRPWVHFTNTNPITIDGPLRFDSTGGHLPVTFNFINGGHLPARFVFIDGSTSVVRGFANEYASSWSKCDSRRTEDDSVMRLGKTVFPEQQSPDNYRIDIPINHIDQLEQFIDRGIPAAIIFSGCIDYSTISDKVRHHQTRFLFEIDKRDPNNSFLHFDPRKGDIPRDQVTLAINPNVPDDAD